MGMMRIAVITLALIVCARAGAADIQWTHPAGYITQETLDEIRAKRAEQPWAQGVWDKQKRAVKPWVDITTDALRAVFPTTRGNVYHNFSCPDDRVRLVFDPFDNSSFRCGTCGKTFAPNDNAGIYAPTHVYYGTLLDGWENLFYSQAGEMARSLAILGVVDNDEAMLARAALLLELFETTVKGLPKDQKDFYSRILTYHREGDNKILYSLAVAYELLRSRLPAERRASLELNLYKRMLDDVMITPYVYATDWNNVYQWHLTVLQVASVLERDELVDWVYGYGDAANIPDHRHLQRILATHFMDDGAFWELCSGYHLYPMNHFCEIAVVGRNLSRMDGARFPVEKYDITDKRSPGGQKLHAAIEWFVGMAMPDRTMTPVGDTPSTRESLMGYGFTAEVGYRYYDVKAVGDYEALVAGSRSWDGLLIGAPKIEKHELPFESSHLSSGWVSLRNEANGNKVWYGLNGITVGGRHQHADRLSLESYSHGQLLALERGVPYNDPPTRSVGVKSFGHNTVRVDQESQENLAYRKGWSDIPPAEIVATLPAPEVAYMHDSPLVKFAELRADNLYPQTTVYRRGVAVIEDIAVDRFNVQGGSVHDWMMNHAGTERPVISKPVQPVTFEPAAWLISGTTNSLGVTTGEQWEARWKVSDVNSRVTMLGAPGTEVYALETFPLGNARITAKHPPVQTLDVRRTSQTPFVAVWDAWKSEPNLVSVEAGSAEGSLKLRTKGHVYHMLFGTGTATFADGFKLTSDGVYCVVRDSEEIALVGGSAMELETPGGKLTARLAPAAGATGDPDGATLWASAAGGKVTSWVKAAVQYETYGGENVEAGAPAVEAKIEGTLWPAGRTAAGAARMYMAVGALR